MAQYRFASQIIGRASGRSAVAAAAYRAGQALTDDRTGLVHDFSRKRGVALAEIMAPDNAPDWMRDRAQLWNAVEKIETRTNSQLAREIQLSLPHELTEAQRIELVRGFVNSQFVARG
ncbi:MobA/MobL family protein, partial [Chelatococcus asaccharovorans]